MAEGYTRQATFIDGDIILAEHGNLEFNKLVNVFNTTTGHRHDDTAGGGAYVPLLKDTSGAQDFTLSNLGVTGSIIKDEDDMVSDSAIHLVTQQSVKKYVDVVQDQVTNLATSNHVHSWGLKTSSFTAAINVEYQVVAATPVNVTLASLTPGAGYVIHNSMDSVDVVQILNPTAEVKGRSGTIPAGTDIILDPGETISLIVQTATIMEVA